MTTAPAAPAAPTARAAGIAYLVTFAASIPALLLIQPVLDDPGYVLGAGADGRVLAGSLLDVGNALACVATAVAVWPVARRVNERLALGFVTTRLVEAGIILVGVACLVAVVALRREAVDAPEAEQVAVQAVGQGLVAVRDVTFQLGPNLCASLNAILFGTLLYRSGLVPRWIPALGLVGAPLLLAATVTTLLGLTEQGSVWFVGALPIAAWELSVGILMTVRGLTPPVHAQAPTEVPAAA